MQMHPIKAGTRSPDGIWVWDGRRWQPGAAPSQPAPPASRRAMASLVLGVVSFIFITNYLSVLPWLPLLGLPLAIASLVLGIRPARGGPHRIAPIAGILAASGGLLFAAYNVGVGFYLASTGRPLR